MKRARPRKINVKKVSHRELCHLAADWLMKDSKHWLVGVEFEGGSSGICDAIGMTNPNPKFSEAAKHRQYLKALDLWQEAYQKWRTGKVAKRARRPSSPSSFWTSNKPKPPRITVVECKRTRSDLLSDLKAGKMLKYEGVATHCYLCCLPQVFCTIPPGTSRAKRKKMILEDLHKKGLPTHWGLLEVTEKATVALKSARKIQTLDVVDLQIMAEFIARSWMFRAVRATLQKLPT